MLFNIYQYVCAKYFAKYRKCKFKKIINFTRAKNCKWRKKQGKCSRCRSGKETQDTENAR